MMKRSIWAVCCRIFVIPAAIFIAVAGCSSAGSTADLPAVADFELERYLGVWYEIARLPHYFERDMDNVSAEYRTDGPGRSIRVINRGRRNGKWHTSTGTVRQRSGKSGGELEVSFFRPFYGAYRIICLDPEYRLAVVTSSTRDHLWLLSRTPEISDEEKKDFMDFAAAAGFDISKLEFPRRKL